MISMRKGGQRILAAMAFVCVLALGLAVQAREFRIQGTDLGGGGAYSGRVSAEVNGNTVKVTWVVGDQRYTGTGVLDGDWLAVYFSGPATGVALYRVDDKGAFHGKWTTTGSSEVGTEDWYPAQ